MTSYRLSRKAVSDLGQIWDYSARQWGVDQADRYVKLLARAFDDIATQRIVGRPTDDVRRGYRRWPVGSHVVYYRADGGIAVIIRILHKRMDVARHF